MLGVSVENFTQLDRCDDFYVPYLESCICSDEILQYIRQRNSIEFCADLEKFATEIRAMIRQANA
jgi:hypothetical protein